MISNAFGLIYTGEDNPKLRELTISRSVAAVPFGGRYRCIDFILSNLVNSGVQSVGLITQKNYHSLMDHLGSGKEWDLHRKREGLFMLPPFMTKENTGVYRGSVDALRSCLGYVRRCPQQYVILSGSHTIFNASFSGLLQQHAQTNAEITFMYNCDESFDPEDQNKDLRFQLDEHGRVTDLELNPYKPHSSYQSCDVLVMDKYLLIATVEEAYARGDIDYMRDVLVRRGREFRSYGYRYDGYVARLNSVKSYFDHSMELLQPQVREDLFNPATPIYTKVKDEVSAKYGPRATVSNSMLADGCNIGGQVENSILFRGVTIGEDTAVRDSIIMQGVTIGSDCSLEHAILDKGVTIQKGRTLIGYDSFPVILKKSTVV